MTYLQWNDAIAAAFFRPEMAGRDVLLSVTHDQVRALGRGDDVGRFINAVAQGPPWADSNLGLCQKALQALDDWRERNLDFPPYIGFLGLFVLAVGVDGPFPPHSYYPRLRTLLGWQDVESGAPPSFD